MFWRLRLFGGKGSICFTFIVVIENIIICIHFRNYRYLYFKNAEVFHRMYTPFYGSLSSYLAGFLTCSWYIKYKAKLIKPKAGIWKYEIGWWLLIIFAIALLSSGFIFVAYDLEKYSIFNSLYAGLFRNMWHIVCGLIIKCVVENLGCKCPAMFRVVSNYSIFYFIGIVRECLHMSIFRTLGRISFQVFLWHVVVIRLLIAYNRQPIYVNRLFVVSNPSNIYPNINVYIHKYVFVSKN